MGGTTNLTMGPWFPAPAFDKGGAAAGTPWKGSFTKLVVVDQQPPSPGKLDEMDKLFPCAVLVGDTMCYERVPWELQMPQKVVGVPPIGIFVPLKHTNKCSLRWITNVFLKRHEPTGSFKSLPSMTIRKDGTCMDFGYGIMLPNPDAVFKNMQVFLKLDLKEPWMFFKNVWTLLYGMVFSDPVNTMQYVSHW